MKKFKVFVALAATVFLTTGCASWHARKGTVQTRYFAAITDWNSVKAAATVAVGNPAVPIPAAEKIVNVMRQGDSQIEAIEAMRVAGTFEGDMAEIALKVLLEAQKALMKLVVSAEAASYRIEPQTPRIYALLAPAPLGLARKGVLI